MRNEMYILRDITRPLLPCNHQFVLQSANIGHVLEKQQNHVKMIYTVNLA